MLSYFHDTVLTFYNRDVFLMTPERLKIRNSESLNIDYIFQNVLYTTDYLKKNITTVLELFAHVVFASLSVPAWFFYK